jgi:hypothetical protein
MNQEKHIINSGERELKNFIEDSLSILGHIEERLSFKKASDSEYLRELGSKYRVLNVHYLGKKPIDADIEPRRYKIKDIRKAHNTINRELDTFDIYVTASVSGIRKILGQSTTSNEYEQRYFDRKFFTDKRKDAEIFEEAAEDFLSRFKKRFGDLTLNNDPLGQIIESRITERIVSYKSTILSSFRKEIEEDIVKDLFRYIIIYAETLKKMIEEIKSTIEQPESLIQGEPWNPKKAVVKEVLREELEKVQRDPLFQYRKQLEIVAKEAAEDSGHEALRTIDAQKEIVITRINELQSNLEIELTQHQKALIRAMEDTKRELETAITQHKNDTVNTIQKYQQQANGSIEEQKQRSIHDLHEVARESMSELQRARDSVVRKFDEELRERREYEITEKLRNISQFIKDHPELNTSVVEYWKNLLSFTFYLHTHAEDSTIPESAKTVWLNGVNQTLRALLTVRNDRLAERAMREGSRYQRIPTTEADCQKVWNRFVAYVSNPQSEDMEFLKRRMTVYATDQTLKNVAIPDILHREGLVEFDRDYRSMNPEKDRSYEARKHYYKAFFTIAYDEMIKRFRELIMNMVV